MKDLTEELELKAKERQERRAKPQGQQQQAYFALPDLSRVRL